MIRVNDNFRELPSVYLFTQISRILAKYREEESPIPLIRMDIGDVPGPIANCVADAMHKAVNDLTNLNSFKGYGPEQGYSFLREIIYLKDYKERGIDIDPSVIFISDGAKCDLGNLGDILSKDCKVAVMDPSYPAYIDDNVIDGREGKLEGNKYSAITYLKCKAENNFYPELPDNQVDIIYLCSPNNPTGSVLPKEELKKWVKYAKENHSLIIFDSAYEAYIRHTDLPKSIYEIEGAKEVAIEIRSFSKTGGFTGIRCGYSVVPKVLTGYYSNGDKVELNSLWSRRQTTKFNGASYISQRGAEALYTDEGRKSVKEMTDRFIYNASNLRKLFEDAGWSVTGGTDSPYVWAGNPFGMSSYEIFETLLKECGISTTPGSGFGEEGEGYIRLSGFNTKDNTDRAIERIGKWLNDTKHKSR
ncbi:MAG: LL-diaminopimelate aminotransferase [Muribaculaceae bacterium]|nr:LL-diaminopimelate aminotransferase [Muribaculaceae bacterium]